MLSAKNKSLDILEVMPPRRPNFILTFSYCETNVLIFYSFHVKALVGRMVTISPNFTLYGRTSWQQHPIQPQNEHLPLTKDRNRGDGEAQSGSGTCHVQTQKGCGVSQTLSFPCFQKTEPEGRETAQEEREQQGCLTGQRAHEAAWQELVGWGPARRLVLQLCQVMQQPSPSDTWILFVFHCISAAFSRCRCLWCYFVGGLRFIVYLTNLPLYSHVMLS